jgi:hypothetical protein
MGAMLKDHLQKQVTEMFFAFCLTVLLIVVAGYLLSFHHVANTTLKDPQNYFLPGYVSWVFPKAQENFIFFSVLLLIPVISLLAILVTPYCMRYLKKYSDINFLGISISCVVALSVIAIFYNSDYFDLLTSPILNAGSVSDGILFLLLVIFITLLYGRKALFDFLLRYKTVGILFLIIGAIILQSFAFRVFGLSPTLSSVFSYQYNPSWRIDFNAVFYSVSQVMAGKTVLADFPEQYGLFAEILKPIFAVIGLSVFKFTVVMAVLQMASLAALCTVLWRLMKSKFLVLLAMLSLCYLTGGIWRFVSDMNWDPYFQYFPIRFIFPALSVWLSMNFLQNTNLKNLTLFSFVSGVAIIWNLDVGIPVAISCLCLLTSFVIFPRYAISRTQACYYFLIACGTIIAVLLLFSVYLWLKADTFIPLVDLTRSQKLYYINGVHMLPIPQVFHPWQVVAATYVLGIVCAIQSWIRKEEGVRWDVLFYLSLLGFGLFIYYEGRSHVYNLLSVSWPALLIGFLLVDYTLRQIQKKRLSRSYGMSCLPLIGFSVLLSASFIYHLPQIFSAAAVNWNSIIENKHDNTLEENIHFIKNTVGEKNKKILILSAEDAVYFGELGLASAMHGPGLSELGSLSDLNNLLKQLSIETADDVFIENNIHSKKFPYDAIITACLPALKSYHLVDQSNAGMLHFSR